MALRSLFDLHHPDRSPDQDLRDYEVRSRRADRPLGRVDDVLVDERDEPRYLSVRMDDGRNVLMPAGHGRVDRQQRSVWVEGLDAQTFEQAPAYDRDPTRVDEIQERRIADTFGAGYGDADYYRRPDFASYEFTRRGRADGRESGQLARLDRLEGYDVAEHSHDPRGWAVFGGDDEHLGEVDYLIGDTGAMQVRYLVVDCHKALRERLPKILVPVGHVSLDPDRHRITIDSLTAQRVGTAPAYQEGVLDRDAEQEITRFYGEGYAPNRRYAHPRYRHQNLFRETPPRHSNP